MTESSAGAVEAVCLRLLARREHSRLELLNKLLARGFPRDRIEPVLDDLSERGWLDDGRFAESYVRQRIEKGFGPNRIDYELRQLGITDFDLETAAAEVAGGWQDALQSVYCKKYRQGDAITLQEWSKRSRFLLQRGFTGAMIAALADRLGIEFKSVRST
ncbi:MAG: recombination regulator RecX [Methylomicrobium sp.]